jgi:hypothetical protein
MTEAMEGTERLWKLLFFLYSEIILRSQRTQSVLDWGLQVGHLKILSYYAFLNDSNWFIYLNYCSNLSYFTTNNCDYHTGLKNYTIFVVKGQFTGPANTAQTKLQHANVDFGCQKGVHPCLSGVDFLRSTILEFNPASWDQPFQWGQPQHDLHSCKIPVQLI